MFYYFRCPDPIEQRNLATGESVGKAVTFKEFVLGTLLHDSRFVANYKSLRTADNIRRAVESTRSGEWIKLADNDYDMLKEVADCPRGLRPQQEPGYPVAGFVQIVPFIAAIMEATSKEPSDAT